MVELTELRTEVREGSTGSGSRSEEVESGFGLGPGWAWLGSGHWAG